MAGTVLSDEIWKNWDKTGKADFVKACKQLLKDESKSPVFTKDERVTQFVNYLYNFIIRGIRGHVKKESVVSVLSDLVAIHSDVCGVICDVLNILDAETFCSENPTEERNNFCAIIKECEKFLSDKVLKERLEIDTLQEVGILKNKSYYTKFIKVKTKLYYKQRKFNLYREESEGFSKLIVELNQDVSESEILLEIIKSLIGCFNLDPNRVLDVILESFENRPERDSLFVPLVQSYMNYPKIICEVLGSKFCFYHSNTESITPKSLYLVTALLLQYRIISLEDIYFWLIPDDKVMVKEAEKEMKDAKEYVRKLQIISIKEKDKEEMPEEKENVQEKYSANQKFGLCEALLDVGDWDNAYSIIQQLPEYVAVDQYPIALALCKLLHAIIEPIYRKYCEIAPKIKGKVIPPFPYKLAPKPAEKFTDLRAVAIPMLTTLGPSLRYDPVLMHKVIRIAKAALNDLCSFKEEQYSEDTLYYDIVTLLDATILPALSFMDCNCCIAEEVWNVLKIYPYNIRYNLYSHWKNDTYQQHPKLMLKRGEAQKQIKNIMKRVSKETIKPVGRLIGKLTHCSPGFLFDYVLLQIQIYDNLIHPVVDSLKYLTSLSYDVLGYCLVESLTQADKNRFKHDGTSISLWLQSLASFCGAIFKKYNIELSGLLQYVANQLKAQKSLDLLILKEIVQKMAGIEAAEELTDEQLDAMAGGELLKGEAGYFSQVRNTKKSSLRLKEAMAEQNLAVTLCLLIAQQKYCVIYQETENSHLKLVGKLYDQCQDTLVQYGTFLGSTLSVDEYVNKLPTIQSMLQHYHIHADVAFFLARPMFNHAINIKYDQLRKLDPNCKKLSTSAKQQKYHEAVKEVMAPIVESVIPLHSGKVWEDISPQFLVSFWSLTMYDLYVPVESYQREINKLRQLSLQAMDSKDVTVSKGKKEQERYLTLMEKLQDEKKKQHEHVEKVLYRLKQEKDQWFLSRSVKSAKNETITQFLQLCLFPRCVYTAVDAAYCAKFVHTIHMLKTANFATLLCYDRLFCDITYSVTSCTENEANRYGRFLCAMLETVMRWHSDKSIYDQECANYPGFVTKYRVSNQFSENCDHVGYENYRHVCHKWHYKITKAMMICLDSKDYVQIRNALIILIKIIPHFPVLNKLATIIEKRVEKVRDEEKNQRQDLFTLAISYAGQLKLRAGQMIKEADFHQMTEKPKNHDNITDGDSEAQTKSVNGEIKAEKDKQASESTKENVSKDTKERAEKKSSRQQSDNTYTKVKPTPQSPNYRETIGKERSDKEKTPQYKDVEVKEKHAKKDKDDKRDESEKDRDRDREKRKERKEEKLAMKDERQYRDERYVEMVLSKDEGRYANDRLQSDRYYGGSDRGSHYYDDRDMGSLSNSNNSTNLRRSQEPPETDRDAKRRKLEGPNSKSSKHEERKMQHQVDQFLLEKPEKKERSSKTKDKRDKTTDEEKELRKERKLGRKRQDRVEEALLQEQKRRRDEEKAMKMMSHNNGEMMEPSVHSREKHHHTRDKSPYTRERERSHDRTELRDKHRRSSEGKRR